MGERAEELGAFVQPETTALRLLVDDGAVRGVQTAPMGLDRAGNAPSGAAPPTEIVAQATVLAEGTQGHLRGVALDHFEVGSRFPQAYEIGVKEIWKVPKPLDRIIHTLGWPLRWPRPSTARSAARSSTRWGPSTSASASWSGSSTPTAACRRTTCCRSSRRTRSSGACWRAAERVAWGAKTIPSGGFHSIPDTLALPGAVLTGDSAGLVNIPRLKGVHYAMHSGMLAAETIYRGLQAGADLAEPGALGAYDAAVRAEPHRQGPAPVPQPAPGAVARPRRWARRSRA